MGGKAGEVEGTLPLRAQSLLKIRRLDSSANKSALVASIKNSFAQSADGMFPNRGFGPAAGSAGAAEAGLDPKPNF